LTVVEGYQVEDLWELNEDTGQWEASFYADGLTGMLTDPYTRLRKLPLRITYPLRREQSVTVHLPDAGWDFPEERQSIEDPAFRFVWRQRGEGSTVRFNYECETLRGEVPVSEVPTYLERREEMEDLLGNILYRPDGSARSVLTRLNWLMVALALLTTMGVGLAMSWVYYRLHRAPPPQPAWAPPMPSERRLQGLGGWLILVGIGLVLNPLVILIQIGVGWESYFARDVWLEVASPRGGQYHALWGPLLMGELMGNLLLFGWGLLLLVLYFGKRWAFPKAYIGFLLFSFLFIALDTAFSQLIPFLAEQADPSSMRDVTRAAIGAAVWCSYMVKSRRVQLTFVN
jgi:hypothetical protein